MTGTVPIKWKVMTVQSGVIFNRLNQFVIELDFDSTGRYLVSCGDDLNWMIWEISDKGYKNKGIIPKTHSRTIYSCSWSKTPIMGEEGE